MKPREETAETAAALARLYDLDLSVDPGDSDLYLALAARTGGPILELAAGTGRLAIPLAEAGHDVTVVDNDPAMLARAQAAAAASGQDVEARIAFVDADIRALALGRHDFRLAILALNSLFLFDRSDQQLAIRALADHLAPGGLAVVDVWLPDADDLRRFDGRVVLEWARLDPETRRHVTKSGAALHDHAAGVVRLVTIFEESAQGEPPTRWLRDERLQLVTTGELVGLVEAAGLEVETLAGSYDLDPLDGRSERAIVVARKPDRAG